MRRCLLPLLPFATGLVVQDTGSYWSAFGQSVILLLIQIGGLGVITVGAALLEGDLSPGKQRKGSAHRNDTQSSDLDQKKDHALPECRPVAAGILNHKPGHTKGRGGSKQRLMERCNAPLL